VRHIAFPDGITRDRLLDWYRSNRARTRSLFELVEPSAYYDRPIALRNPIIFYEGHLPAFAINTLVKLTLKRDGIDESFETLFARGIDPADAAEVRSPTELWPSREEVQAYGAAADAMLLETLAEVPLQEAVFTILEHEQMHQETLLYMLHNLACDKKRGSAAPRARGGSVDRRMVRVPAGRVTLGGDAGTFGWDNEFPSFHMDVNAFEIDAHNVTNGEYLEFVESGAKPPHFWLRENDEWKWRGMFAAEPLPLDAPVYVTHEEAAAYARWKGRRLPTEAEYHRAAFGTPSGEERLQPWGDEPADASRGNFDFGSYEPVDVGLHEKGASAWGVHDLAGNGWEWTSTEFAGFPGFAPMQSYPLYSVDFFDGAHYVMKGASPVTAKELVRRSFRNWFRPNYPYVYATFRTVR
jgi:iron(II)-dependent oxidoreductase